MGPGRALADGAGDIGSTIYTRRMAAMEYEAVPAVDADAEATPLGTVVMKFGGTSVGDADRLKRVASRLVAAREEGHRVVGVLSAMGHTTDELLELARQISSTPHPRELDMLVSVGERISCALAAMVIHDLGHEAISFTGSQAGIVTDTVHGKAKIVEVRARRIHEALDDGRIVLVAGFQGVSTAYEVTTLGRGGSDTTAVALAAALGAQHCEIYTDVRGVYTADPRLVPGRASCGASASTRCSRWRPPVPACSPPARSRSPAVTMCGSTCAPPSRKEKGRGSRRRTRRCSRRP